MDTAVWVRDYIDHLEDGAYVRELFASEGVGGVSRVLVAMLRSGDAHEANAAFLFIRDVVNYAMVPVFTAYLPRCGIFDALRANLYAPDYAIRRGSIYTIGKIGPRANARLLAEAFPIYLQRARSCCRGCSLSCSGSPAMRDSGPTFTRWPRARTSWCAGRSSMTRQARC